MIPQSHRKILNYRFVSASADTKRTPPSPAGVYPTEGRVSDRVPYAVRKAYKVERILTNHPYNDLGLLARKKLIVLAEAESDWSIIYRLAGYYFDSMEQFATQALHPGPAFRLLRGYEKRHRGSISLYIPTQV